MGASRSYRHVAVPSTPRCSLSAGRETAGHVPAGSGNFARRGTGRGAAGGRFAKLWTASTTSALGSGLATIAVPLLVASRTNNPLLLAKDRLHIGSVGYGLLFTCSAVGGVLGSAAGDRI
jgi:hypothetical protein